MNVDFFACCVAPARIIRVTGEATTSLTQGGNSSLTTWRVGGRASESTAPTVRSITPADGSRIRVPTLRVTFSEDMDTYAIDNVLALRDASGNAVAAVVRWLSDREPELQPAQPMADGAWQASLGAGVQDRAGNVLAARPLWRLTTEATAPRLAQRTPGPGSINVAPGAAIRMVFDEALVNPLAQPGLVSLRNELGTAIPGRLTLEGDRTLVFTATSPLPPGQRLTVELGSITDTLGNIYAGDRWTFDVDPGRFALPAALIAPFNLNQGSPKSYVALDCDNNGRAELLTLRGGPDAPFGDALFRTQLSAAGVWETAQRLQPLAVSASAVSASGGSRLLLGRRLVRDIVALSNHLPPERADGVTR